jgi:TPR repeat protein
MSTLAVLGIAALIVGGSQLNPAPEQPRAAAPISAPAANALARARTAEQDGQVTEAVRLYKESATAGSGEAAKRLGDLYWRGGAGVERDLAESLRWYRVAETRGEKLAQAVRMR